MLVLCAAPWSYQQRTPSSRSRSYSRSYHQRTPGSSTERLVNGLVLAGSDVDCGVPPSRTLPLLPDADLVSFLDGTFGLASAPNVSLATRASCYSRLLLQQYNYGLGVIDEANRVLAINYHSQMVTKAVWTRWSRQARGTVVHLLPSGRFTLLKRLLGPSGMTWELIEGQDLQGRYDPGLFPVDRLRARVAKDSTQ